MKLTIWLTSCKWISQYGKNMSFEAGFSCSMPKHQCQMLKTATGNNSHYFFAKLTKWFEVFFFSYLWTVGLLCHAFLLQSTIIDLLPARIPTMQKYRTLFRIWDYDRKGYLTPFAMTCVMKELHDILGQLSVRDYHREAISLFARMDKDKDCRWELAKRQIGNNILSLLCLLTLFNRTWLQNVQ